jgi:ADP-ribose pyrophosphatase YjhB (NUDIX family)
MATIHKKVWPEYFEKIISGKKKIELRLADFEVNEGDTLVLEEYNNNKKEYTGRKVEVVATYIFRTKGQTFWPPEDVKKYGFQIIQFEPKTQKKFHLRVRALIRDDDHILVARVKGENYCFLLGGHHEIGESLSVSLIREIKEEIGLSAETKEYLGVVENCWLENNIYHREINHVFEVKISNFNAEIKPHSQEDHLEFFWIRSEDFDKQNLLPKIVRPLVKNWLKGSNKIWHESNFE